MNRRSLLAMLGLAPVAAVAAPALARDTVSARLSAGEFVTGSASLNGFSVETLDMLNRPMTIKSYVQFANGDRLHLGPGDHVWHSCEYLDDASPKPCHPMTDGDGI
jgi:hypothetical protein